MKRRQIIRAYLKMSLKKRLWMVILPAVILGTVAFLLTTSLPVSLPVTFLTALCTTGGILRSSYQRHLRLGDFPSDRELKMGNSFIFDD